MNNDETIEYLFVRKMWSTIAEVEPKVEDELSFGARLIYVLL